LLRQVTVVLADLLHLRLYRGLSVESVDRTGD
jgi:hypothetical protein